MNARTDHAALIKTEAKRLGFISCGISKAGFLAEEAPRLESWLKGQMQGSMTYMERNFDKRLDPTKLVPGAKSVVSLLYNYFPSQEQETGTYKISKYAYGEDYHYVIKDKLKDLMTTIRDQIGAVEGRVFVDSAPILEKAWAAKSGLGWVGKHSNLLSKQVGSFFFIAELIIDLDLAEDGLATDHGGSCTACIDACPTKAIIGPYVVDGNKCISHLTIELKDQIPNAFSGALDDWMFGCDVCQDVCPWNRFSQAHNEPLFQPNAELLQYSKAQWAELTEEVFHEIFKKSAVQRAGYSGLIQTIKFLKD